MSRTNHTLSNPAIGHQVTFLQTAAQTNGQLLQIEYAVERPESEPAIPSECFPLYCRRNPCHHDRYNHRL